MLPDSSALRHPRALYLLFATEMWERLSYYGMQALLVLYMRDRERGGLGFSQEASLRIFAAYTFAVYLSPTVGGLVADRFLGQRKAVLIGAGLMMVGHFSMALRGLLPFYAALALLVLGTGLFKPNISSLVGALYEAGDPRRESAFTLFYMGINLGALLAPLVVGTLGEKVGWHAGFVAAGVGMAISLVLYASLAHRLLGSLGRSPRRSAARRGSLPPLTREQWHRLLVIVVLSAFAVFFWGAFQQAGGLINLFTERKVDRRVLGWLIPATWFQGAEPAFVLLLGPFFGALWVRLARRPDGGPSTPVKVAAGLFGMGVAIVPLLFAVRAAETGLAPLAWILGFYFVSTIGELALSPVAMSAVTRFAPAHLVSLMMGVWLVSIGAGSWIGNYASSYANRIGVFQFYVWVMTVLFGAALAVLSISPWLRSWTHGADRFGESVP